MSIHHKRKRLRLLLIAAAAVGCGAATLSGTLATFAISSPAPTA